MNGPAGPKKFDCPVDGFQQMISGKYKLKLLWDLADGPMRNGELKRRLSETNGSKPITARVLSRELKALMELGMVERTDYRSVPARVEYSLTEQGRSLLPVIAQMHRWAIENLLRKAAVHTTVAEVARSTGPSL